MSPIQMKKKSVANVKKKTPKIVVFLWPTESFLNWKHCDLYDNIPYNYKRGDAPFGLHILNNTFAHTLELMTFYAFTTLQEIQNTDCSLSSWIFKGAFHIFKKPM